MTPPPISLPSELLIVTLTFLPLQFLTTTFIKASPVLHGIFRDAVMTGGFFRELEKRDLVDLVFGNVTMMSEKGESPGTSPETPMRNPSKTKPHSLDQFMRGFPRLYQALHFFEREEQQLRSYLALRFNREQHFHVFAWSEGLRDMSERLTEHLKPWNYRAYVNYLSRMAGRSAFDYVAITNDLSGEYAICASDKNIMMDYIQMYPQSFVNAAQYLKEDPEVVKTAVRRSTLSMWEHVPEKLSSNRKLVLELVACQWRALRDVPSQFKDDIEVALQAVRQSEHAFTLASQTLRDSRDFVLQAVRENPAALQYVSSAFNSDHDIIRTAMENWPTFRRIAESRDHEFILSAICCNARAYMCMNVHDRCKEDIAKKAIRANWRCIKFIPVELHSNEQVVMEAAMRDQRALQVVKDDAVRGRVLARLKQSMDNPNG